MGNRSKRETLELTLVPQSIRTGKVPIIPNALHQGANRRQSPPKNNTHQNYQKNGQELKGEESGKKYSLEEEESNRRKYID